LRAGDAVRPAHGQKHGRVCFGSHEGCEDGMNDQGLLVAVAAAPPNGQFESNDPPMWCPVALDAILADCATVEEALAWWKNRSNPNINSTVATRPSFLGLRRVKKYVSHGVGGHLLLADKAGNSVVCEWQSGRLKVIRKTGRYQLITNFQLSNPRLGGHPCPRFDVVSKILDQAEGPSVERFATALKAAANPLTRYSLVYDLARGEAHVFGRGRFDCPKTHQAGAGTSARPA
jgi:choloylglycine hydrolase